MQYDARTTLAENLKRWIQSHADREGRRYSVRAWALEKGLDVRLIDRLSKGQNAVTLDTLDEIAGKLGIQPWHLLLPDADLERPANAPLTQEDADLLARIKALASKSP
jgi:transcriptional regulator with XRE-family HTH domain